MLAAVQDEHGHGQIDQGQALQDPGNPQVGQGVKVGGAVGRGREEDGPDALLGFLRRADGLKEPAAEEPARPGPGRRSSGCG